MKVLIFECWNNAPQFETGLEIADIHAENGDDVVYVNIADDLSFIEWQTHNKLTPITRKALKYIIRKKLERAQNYINSSIDYNVESLLSESEIKSLYSEFSFKDIEELKKYEWNSFDLGMGAASSLISVTNDLDPDVSTEYQSFVNEIIHSSKIMAKSFEKWLESSKPDMVYFRNGRVANYRPLYRICRERNIDFRIHDRGCNKDHYSINRELRHDFESINEEILSTWENEKDTVTKNKVAEQYYLDRQKGKEQTWVAFCQNMTKKKMPENWDNDKFNIVYFNSSIGEFAAVNGEQFDRNIFKNQFEAIDFIVDTVKGDKSVDFHIRLHPNLLNQNIKEQVMWSALEGEESINLIPPESDIDSYSLVQNADLIVVHYSTVGMEAAFMNKPVVQLSVSEYHKLGSTYFPNTKEELKQLLLDKSLKAKPNLGAKKFGYYFNTYGKPFKYFEADSLLSGTYKKVNLQKEPAVFDLLRKLKNKLS